MRTRSPGRVEGNGLAMAGHTETTRSGEGAGGIVRRALSRYALDRAGLVVLLGIGLTIGVGWAFSSAVPADLDAYWRGSINGPVYGTIWRADAVSGYPYVYPPPLAQLLQPLHALGWQVVVTVWTVCIFLALWGSTRWWSLPVLAVSVAAALGPGFGHALANPLTLALLGNIQSVIALAILLGFRWPAAWAFVLLTKISPGIGVLWFAVRGEWQNLGIAVGTTAAVAAVSFVVAPSAWLDFVRFATANVNTPAPVPVVPVPFFVRLAMSAALIVWGARTNRRWTVPIAAGWASLALYEWGALTVWLAALPLVSSRSRGDLVPWRDN